MAANFSPHPRAQYSIKPGNIIDCQIAYGTCTVDIINNIKSYVMTQPTRYFQVITTLAMTCKFLDEYVERIEQLLDKGRGMSQNTELEELTTRPMKILKNSLGTELLTITFKKEVLPNMWRWVWSPLIYAITIPIESALEKKHIGRHYLIHTRENLPNMYFEVELESCYSVQRQDPLLNAIGTAAQIAGCVVSITSKVAALK